jgi:hypothetical protein
LGWGSNWELTQRLKAKVHAMKEMTEGVPKLRILVIRAKDVTNCDFLPEPAQRVLRSQIVILNNFSNHPTK